MADQHWINGAADNDFETVGNWSATKGGASNGTTPGSSDDVFFSDDTADNCNLSANISIASLQFTSSGTYTGTFDAATFDVTISGNCSNNAPGATIDFGSGAWTIAGNFMCRNMTVVPGTAAIELTGASKSWTYTLGKLYSITVTGSYSMNGGNTQTDRLIVNGSLNVNTGSSLPIYVAFTLAAGATLDGTSNVRFHGGCTTSFGAGSTLAPGTVSWYRWGGGSTATIPARTYDCDMFFEAGVNGMNVVFAGNTTINGYLQLNAQQNNAGYPLTVNNNTNNPDLTVQGNITRGSKLAAANFTWNKGTGTFTLDGTANQDFDLSGETWEDIDIDKTAGVVTLTGDGSTDSCVVTDGTLDIDGNNLTTIASGNFTAAAGTTVQDTTGGGLITVDGNFICNGSSSSGVIFNGPDLDVTGMANASYTTATNSNASAGTAVTAVASTDGTGNTNWTFSINTVTTTIGTNSIAGTVNSVTGSSPGPYTVTMSATVDSSILVGDTLLTDPSDTEAAFLITGISGSDLTVTEQLGGIGPPDTGSADMDRTYSSVSAWESNLDTTTLYSAGDTVVGHLTNDNTYNETVVINGGTTVDVLSVELTSPTGERHDGSDGSGARFVITSAIGDIIAIDRSNCTISWIEVDANASASSLRIIAGESSFTDRKVNNCILHDHIITSLWAFGVDIRSTGVTSGLLAVHNNLVYDIKSSSTDNSHTAVGIICLTDEAGDVSYIYNNLVDRVVRDNSTAEARGIQNSDFAGELVKNNIVAGVDGTTSGSKVDYKINSPSNAGMDYNSSEDTTASGANSLNSKAMSVIVVSNTNGAEDYTLNSNSVAFETGVDLGTTPSGVEIDITGLDRDATAAIWSMGPSQLKDAGVAAGLATESNISQVALWAKAVSLALVTESNLALAAVAVRIQSVGLSTESDISQVIASLKLQAVGLTTESDISQVVSSAKQQAIGLSTESNISQIVGILKTEIVGLSIESDISQATTSLKLQAAGITTESDVSQTVGILKTEIVGQSTESDVAQNASPSFVGIAGLSTESNISQSLTPLEIHAVGFTTEYDTSQTINILKTEIIGQSTESDTSQAITPLRTTSIELTTESNISQTTTPLRTTSVGLSVESDVASAAIELGNPQRAIELDISQAITALRTTSVGMSTESDISQTTTIAKGDEVGLTTELDISQVVVHSLAGVAGLSTESDTSQATARVEYADMASESNISLPTQPERKQLSGLVVESNSAFGVISSLAIVAGQTTEQDAAHVVGLAFATLVIESNISQAITSSELHPALGLVAESDSALAALATLLVGLTTESDISLKTTVVDLGLVGLSIESDISQSLAAVRIESVLLATESDISQVAVAVRTLAAGLSVESDDAFSVTSKRSRDLPLSVIITELDTSQAIASLKTESVGLSVESDASLATTIVSTGIAGLSTESDVSLTATSLKEQLVGLSIESDASQTTTPLKTEVVGLSTESNAVIALGALKTEILSLATEQDQALIATPDETHVAALVIESDTTLSTTKLKLQAVGLSTEENTALDIGRPFRVNDVGQTTEQDSVLAAVQSKLVAVGLSVESDDALVIGPLKTEIVGLSTESDIIHTLGILSEQLVGQAVESDDAFAVVAIEVVSTGQATESDTTFSVAKFKLLTTGQATEVDSVLLMTAKKAQSIGLSVETDSATGMSPERLITIGLATEEDISFAVTTLELASVAITIESDIALTSAGIFLVVVPIGVVKGEVFLPGVQQGEVFIAGVQKGEVFIPGIQQGELGG